MAECGPVSGNVQGVTVTFTKTEKREQAQTTPEQYIVTVLL